MSDEVLVISETEQLVLREVVIEVIDLTQHSELIEIAQQGPPGPTGPVGPAGLPGGAAQTAIAGEALGGHRAVVLDAAGSALYADCSLLAHFGRVAGITDGAVAEGDIATLVGSGVMVEPSWSWAPNAPVFLGSTGLLTQAVPSDGFQQIVGIALSPTTLFINPREPLFTV